jgi:hypothetical protein
MNKMQLHLLEITCTAEDFAKLLNSGMYFEYFPESDGTYENFLLMKRSYGA